MQIIAGVSLDGVGCSADWVEEFEGDGAFVRMLRDAGHRHGGQDTGARGG